MKKNILVFTSEFDVHADRILSFNNEIYNFVRLNLDQTKQWSLSYLNGDIRIRTRDTQFGIDEISSVFLRRAPNLDSFLREVPAEYSEYSEYFANQEFTLFSDCLAVLDASVPFVNPLASSSRGGKGVQAKLALEVGLLTPDTYIGSDPKKALLFCNEIFEQGRLVCTKPVVNTKVKIEGEDKTRFTTMLERNSLEHIGSLEHCPIIFQGYVEKAYEIRATVIGEKILAAKIDSQSAGGGTAIDWRRYNLPKTPHSTYEFPPEIANKIVALQKRLGLIYSSFDFIRTPDGEYVFLETNSFGQWLWIEDLTGLPISSEIATYLMNPQK